MSGSLSQRDLRLRSKEIMDAVEGGASFTVTRNGRGIGELIALRRTRRFVTRDAFFESARHAAIPDPDAFRVDLDRAADEAVRDPYDG